MNSPSLELQAPAGAFVVQDPAGVRALLRAFAAHLGDGAWNPIPDFSGDLTPGEVRKYVARVALAAEGLRGDDAPCIFVRSPYQGHVQVTWESRGTHGRWVRLGLSSAGWTLDWDSGTGRQSQFIQQRWMEELLRASPGLE